MTVEEMVSRSGYSRQRLNKLVDAGLSRGVRRKPSGRLEVFDQELAARWCDLLRMRKVDRHQRNIARIEWRDRLKVRRMVIASQTVFNKIAGKALLEATESIRKEITKQSGFFGAGVDGYARDVARRSVKDVLQPTGFQRAQFCLKGRSEATIQARGTLFDFIVSPQQVPEIRSYADIARHYGCTRAAVSAMCKDLPPELLSRSGRTHSVRRMSKPS